MFNSQLTGLIEAKDAKLGLLKEHASQVKAKYQVMHAACAGGAGIEVLTGNCQSSQSSLCPAGA